MKKILLISLMVWLAVAGFSQTIAKINPVDARALLAKDSTVLVLDVRTPGEYASGHISGAKLLPYDQITAVSAASLTRNKDQTIVVYCRSGHRAGIAAANLVKLGYTHILDLGGLMHWPFELVKGSE